MYKITLFDFETYGHWDLASTLTYFYNQNKLFVPIHLPNTILNKYFIGKSINRSSAFWTERSCDTDDSLATSEGDNNINNTEKVDGMVDENEEQQKRFGEMASEAVRK